MGDSGTILYTSDGGNHWNVSHIGFLPSLFSVCFKNQREGWAVGQNGFSLKTDDGGRNWEKVTIEPPEAFKAVNVVTIGNIVAFAVVDKTMDIPFGRDAGITAPSEGQNF